MTKARRRTILARNNAIRLQRMVERKRLALARLGVS